MAEEPSQARALRATKDAERFDYSANLADYDLSGARLVRFQFERKEAQIHMRVPRGLLEAVKARAKECGIPYTRYIRESLEDAVTRK